jgi:tetratricopeptide (TPR) repeat protein
MLYLADTEIQIRQIENAGPLLEKVVKLNPKLALGHLDLGIVLDQNGRKQDALREMKEAARLDPDNVNVHWRLGRLYRSMGKIDEAKAEFSKASSINKATDSALVDKINNGHNGPPSAQQPASNPEK